MQTHNNLVWIFASLYYSRDKWHNLIAELHQLKIDEVLNTIITYSVEKGEHIRVSFSCSEENKNEVKAQLNTHFKSFFSIYPSILSKPFHFGKTLWMNNENNMIYFDIFSIDFPTYDSIAYYQHTSNLILKLAKQDYSQDTYINIALYVLINILKFIPNCEIEETLNYVIEKVAMTFGNHNILNKIDNITNELELNKISVFEILDSYWEEDKNEITDLIFFIKNLLGNDLKVYFQNIEHFLLNNLDLNSHHNMFILQLISKWYSNKNIRA